jgi:hypothetical protein
MQERTMPIQFRCGSCKQLLGIATRKAGHVVNCPTCGNKTVVPRDNPAPVKAPVHQPALAGAAPDTMHAGPEEPPGPVFTAEPDEPVGLSLLDRVDMDALLAPPKEGQPVAQLPPPAPAPAPKQEAPAETKRPARKKNLEFTAMPPVAQDQEPEPEPEADDLDSLPDLDVQTNPNFTLVLTPMRVTVLVVLLIALLAGVLLLGMWLGSRFTTT